MVSKTRKAPTASATLFKPGTTKTGNDGNKWTIIADTRGVQRWRKIDATATHKTMTMKRRRRGKSARVLATAADTDSVWGKNKPLEKFWQDLASGRKVVVIYAKNPGHKIVEVPTGKTAIRAMFDGFDADPNIVAVLSSNMSQDAYEVYLYPKARDTTVEYVIQHYKKFFKSSGPMPADLVEKGIPAQKKVMYPA
jgi:hypothetical protein